MKPNLDSLRSEIERYLTENGFLIFRGLSRGYDESPTAQWDSARHPDYREFLAIARHLDVKVVLLHATEFAAGLIDDVMDELESRFEYDEDGSIRRRLNELRVYEGFICALELSYEHDGTLYIYQVAAPWYEEFEDIQDELELIVPEDESGEDSAGGMPGYYSKN